MVLVRNYVVVKKIGHAEYLPTLEAMRAFTAGRDAETPDELWLLEHPPVYTLGLGADAAHGPKTANGIPVVQTERGGEVTYHGPGQLVLYTLVDLARRGIQVREFVRLLERSVVEMLALNDISATAKPNAPGVYVNDAKIGALGIRVSRGRAYHGLALNVDMDLAPFSAIDPCGFPGLAVTQMRDLGFSGSLEDVGTWLAGILSLNLEHA